MKKLSIFLSVMLVLFLMMTTAAMADSTRVTGTGPHLVATGDDYVITAIWSVTCTGSVPVEVIATSATYTAGTTVFDYACAVGGTLLENKFIDLTTVYHYLQNPKGMQWNNGVQGQWRQDINLDCEDGIVIDFNSNSGTAIIFYSKKAEKQADVNFGNAE